MRTFHVIIFSFSRYPCDTFSHFVFFNSCTTPCFSAYNDLGGSFDCWFNLHFCYFCLDAVAVSQNKRLRLIRRNIHQKLKLSYRTVLLSNSPFSSSTSATSLVLTTQFSRKSSSVNLINHEVWLRKHGWTAERCHGNWTVDRFLWYPHWVFWNVGNYCHLEWYCMNEKGKWSF